MLGVRSFGQPFQKRQHFDGAGVRLTTTGSQQTNTLFFPPPGKHAE